MKGVFIVLMLLAATSVQAALTVDSYYEMQSKHGKDNEAINLQVQMYLDGLLDGLFMASQDVPKDKKAWCIPDHQQVTDQLARELFENELRERADEYAEFAELGIQVPFSLVMADALQRAYPCKSK